MRMGRMCLLKCRIRSASLVKHSSRFENRTYSAERSNRKSAFRTFFHDKPDKHHVFLVQVPSLAQSAFGFISL